MYPPGMHCGSLDLHSSLDRLRPWVRNLDMILLRVTGADPIFPSNVKRNPAFKRYMRRLKTRDTDIRDWGHFQVYISNFYIMHSLVKGCLY